ncbi:response regulator [Marinobacter sediminum]|uniref:response regulator n=1 Tax=Marinobacter sediminum TaxID=256323 RepID=UPI00356AEFE3
MTKTKIMIVDDHPIFRAGLANLIGRDERYSVVSEAAGMTEAMDLLKANLPQLVLVDLTLSEGSGLQFIKRLHAHDSAIKILVVSMHDDKIYAERSLRAGAHGYINKEQAASKLIGAIEDVMRGSIYLDPDIAAHIVQRRTHHGDRLVERPEAALTDRELEVFTLMGRGISSTEIANQLCLSPKTVGSHRDHIKKKLGIQKNSELMQRAVAWVLTVGD